MNVKPYGRSRKRPLLDIGIERLHPDAENSRLPKKLRGKSEVETISILKKYFDLEELAYSMVENGYFDEEPIVAIPQNLPDRFAKINPDNLSGNNEYIEYLKKDTTHFTVVEGNRRLASVKILLSEKLRLDLKLKNWPELHEKVEDDLKILPVIVYKSRDEVLPYMGVRHITGIKKWDAFSKALYIVNMIEHGMTIEEIQQAIGDRSNSARKIYLCYKLVETVENEFELNTEKAALYFSYLLLSVGQGAVKDFLGIPKRLVDVDYDNPVPPGKLKNLKELFSWLFGNGKEEFPVIKESRDITNYLAPVLRNEEALEHMRLTRDLTDAYERSEGEKVLLTRNLRKANKWIENSIGILSRHKSDRDVTGEIERFEGNIQTIKKILEG